MADPAKLQMRFFTKDDRIPADVLADALSAADGLFGAVAKEMHGIDGAHLSVLRFGYVCDGCGVDRPDDHADWRHDPDGHDWCPACVAAKEAGDA